MTLKDLEYFIAISREKSITRAAAMLYVAQPALSQCLQKIEKEMGVSLVVRNSSGVVLTSEGVCFLEFAQRVLQERSELAKKIRDVKNAENGEIRLGFTGTQATYVLPYILPEFQSAHPGVTITLVEAHSDEIETKLLRNEVDIGILHPPILNINKLNFFEISSDDIIVLPRRISAYQDFIYYKDGCDEPYLDLNFFREEPVILTLPTQRSRMVCDQIFANAGIVPKVQQVCRSIITLNALAEVDYASVLVPRKQLSPETEGRDIFRIDESIAVPYTFVVATAKDAYLPIAVRNLIEEFMKKKYTF
ncbi:MAG: LysR family transcriptional regulator [Oscillibacter sp.]|nr:LysR family transcriptional regulator [Oscillibacter sp.]